MNKSQPQPSITQDHLTEPISFQITPKCRICETEQGQLISPCMCKGKLAHIHPICLAQQIQNKKIMNVASVHGIYNSKCSFCKFHIEFVIQEQYFQFSPQGISLALKSLNEDSLANLSLNISLAILIFTIITVTFIGHLQTQSQEYWNFNCKLIFLEILLTYLFLFLLQNIFSTFPFKTKKPIPVICLTQ